MDCKRRPSRRRSTQHTKDFLKFRGRNISREGFLNWARWFQSVFEVLRSILIKWVQNRESCTPWKPKISSYFCQAGSEINKGPKSHRRFKRHASFYYFPNILHFLKSHKWTKVKSNKYLRRHCCWPVFLCSRAWFRPQVNVVIYCRSRQKRMLEQVWASVVEEPHSMPE